VFFYELFYELYLGVDEIKIIDNDRAEINTT